jgi:hypothetical protein
MTSETNSDFCFTNGLNTEETNDSDYEDLPPIPTGEDFTDATNLSNGRKIIFKNFFLTSSKQLIFIHSFGQINTLCANI